MSKLTKIRTEKETWPDGRLVSCQYGPAPFCIRGDPKVQNESLQLHKQTSRLWSVNAHLEVVAAQVVGAADVAGESRVPLVLLQDVLVHRGVGGERLRAQLAPRLLA